MKAADTNIGPESVAEQAVIGACMAGGAPTVDAVCDHIGPSDFADARLGRALAAIMQVIEQGRGLDAVTIAYAMTGGDWKLVESGGLEEQLTTMGEHVVASQDGALSMLIAIQTSAVNYGPEMAAHYAEHVAGYARLRRLRAVGQSIIAAASRARPDEVDAAVNAALADIMAVDGTTAAYQVTDGYEAQRASFMQTLKRMDNPGPSGIPTGLNDLDDLVQFTPGEMYTVGADTGHGKTAFGVYAAFQMAATCTVAYFTLEVLAPSIGRRLNAMMGRFNQRDLMTGRMTRPQAEGLAAHITHRKDQARRMRLVAGPALTTQTIEREIRKLARQAPAEFPLRVVFVDYLQLVKAPGRHDGREREVAAISEAMKAATLRHELVVVGLSQLNRASATRANKRPVLSDLRESSQMAHDSAAVLLLYRPEKHGEQGKDNICEVIVPKNRDGQEGAVSLLYQAAENRFGDLDWRHR